MKIFESVKSTIEALEGEKYIASHEIATTVYLALKMEKPIRVEGPAGVGKTELGKCVSQALNMDLIRLQCYEGLDESKALYCTYIDVLRLAESGASASWTAANIESVGDVLVLKLRRPASRPARWARQELNERVPNRGVPIPEHRMIQADHQKKISELQPLVKDLLRL